MTVWSAILWRFHQIENALSDSSDDTPALVDSASPGTPTSTRPDIAGGATGTFSPDDTDGDRVHDDQDADSFDASSQ
jgi:hypothetical protein